MAPRTPFCAGSSEGSAPSTPANPPGWPHPGDARQEILEIRRASASGSGGRGARGQAPFVTGTNPPSSSVSTAPFTNVSRRLFRPGDLAPSSPLAARPSPSPAPIPEHLLDPRLRPGGEQFLAVTPEQRGEEAAGTKRAGSSSPSRQGLPGNTTTAAKRPRLEQPPRRFPEPAAAVAAFEQSANRQLFLGEPGAPQQVGGESQSLLAGYTHLPVVFDHPDPLTTGRIWVPVNLDGLTDPHWREFPPNYLHPRIPGRGTCSEFQVHGHDAAIPASLQQQFREEAAASTLFANTAARYNAALEVLRAAGCAGDVGSYPPQAPGDFPGPLGVATSPNNPFMGAEMASSDDDADADDNNNNDNNNNNNSNSNNTLEGPGLAPPIIWAGTRLPNLRPLSALRTGRAIAAEPFSTVPPSSPPLRRPPFRLSLPPWSFGLPPSSSSSSSSSSASPPAAAVPATAPAPAPASENARSSAFFASPSRPSPAPAPASGSDPRRRRAEIAGPFFPSSSPLPSAGLLSPSPMPPNAPFSSSSSPSRPLPSSGGQHHHHRRRHQHQSSSIAGPSSSSRPLSLSPESREVFRRWGHLAEEEEEEEAEGDVDTRTGINYDYFCLEIGEEGLGGETGSGGGVFGPGRTSGLVSPSQEPKGKGKEVWVGEEEEDEEEEEWCGCVGSGRVSGLASPSQEPKGKGKEVAGEDGVGAAAATGTAPTFEEVWAASAPSSAPASSPAPIGHGPGTAFLALFVAAAGASSSPVRAAGAPADATPSPSRHGNRTSRRDRDDTTSDNF
ncbi:hypothetical protein VTK26DRAFT_986 [Humicola hyalothermophila]